MVTVAVRPKGFQIRFQLIRIHFPLMLRKSKHLMTGMLNCSRLVGADMSRLDSDNALPALQKGRDHHGIRLCPAHKKPHVRIGALASRTDLLSCALAVNVGTVAGLRFQIRLHQSAKDLRMCARRIITFKRKHKLSLLFVFPHYNPLPFTPQGFWACGRQYPDLRSAMPGPAVGNARAEAMPEKQSPRRGTVRTGSRICAAR